MSLLSIVAFVAATMIPTLEKFLISQRWTVAWSLPVAHWTPSRRRRCRLAAAGQDQVLHRHVRGAEEEHPA
jgi:hypothetical protein